MQKTMTAIDRFAVNLATLTIKYKYLVLLLAILLTGIIASGAQYLSFASNYRVFFSKENPELTAFEDLQATYTKNDNFLILIKPKVGTVFTPETLSIVEKLTLESWQIPHALRVDSITNFQHSHATEDDLIVEDLAVDALSLSPIEIARIENIALNEPLLKHQLVTPDSAVTAVNVVLQYPLVDQNEVPQAVAFVRAIRTDFEQKYPDHTFALTGISMLNNAFVESGQNDVKTLVPVMYLILLVLMIISVRSFSGTVSTLTVILFASLVAVGFGGFMGIELTPISAAAPTIVLTLAIADSIHILISMRSAQREGMDKNDALIEGIRVNFLAVSITSLTTAIGFLALNTSDAPPFQHLGNMSAIGIAAAWILSLTLLPALIAILPGRAPKFKPADRQEFMSVFATFVIKKRKMLLAGTTTIALTLIALTPYLEFDDQWIEYFDEAIEFRRDSDFASEYFGLYTVEYSLPAQDPGGISDPDFLKKLEEFTVFLRSQDHVKHVFSLTDIMKRLNRNMHGDDPTWYKLPDDRNLSAQYLLLYELSLPFGLDLNDRINIDKSATRITVTLAQSSTVDLQVFLDKSRNWIKENAPDYMQTVKPTSPSVMFAYIAQRNVDSMISGTVIAILIISLIMVLSLRSLRLGMLSLIPNGLPIIATFGTWVLLYGKVGFSVAAVASVSLGIIVDDTVHFLSKYNRGIREKGLDRGEAVKYAFETVGNALVINTFILVLGFAFLATSHFKLNADMGLLTALAILFALFFDFLLLPALLLIGYKDKDEEKDDAATTLLKNRPQIAGE